MKFKLILLLSAVCATACQRNLGDDEAALLDLHASQRAAHFEKNANALVDQLSDNFLSVSRGIVDSIERENDIKGFDRYFRSVEFRKWDDLHPPIIRFSDDHSMAYMIVDKVVEVETTDSLGNAVIESTHFVWVTICRRDKDTWKIECVASTNEPATSFPGVK